MYLGLTKVVFEIGENEKKNESKSGLEQTKAVLFNLKAPTTTMAEFARTCSSIQMKRHNYPSHLDLFDCLLVLESSIYIIVC